MALQTNTNITRYNYTLKAHYELIPAGTTAAAKTGDLTALTAYNARGQRRFSTRRSRPEQDAKNRAANTILPSVSG